MKQLLKTGAIVLCTLLITSSCKKNDDPGPDTTAPTVTFTKPLEAGTTTYTRGSYMDMTATFKDDRALKSCVVTISYNQPQPAAGLKGIGSPWAPAEDGTEHLIEFEGEKEKAVSVNLFDDAIETSCLGGSYTLKFVILDKSDNETIKMVDVTLE